MRDSDTVSSVFRPWLSVVLPVYRGEEWLDRTLGSVAPDADAGVEILIIDSSPTPDTMAIVKNFADRLTLNIIDPDGIDGCSPKMNLGVARARADHVTWLCQDDLWLPGRIAAIRRWIADRPDAALHLAPTAVIDRDDRRLGTWRCPLAETPAPVDRATLLERLLVQNFIAVPSPVIRRDAWLACGGLDLGLWYTGDWDMWLKLSAHGEVVYHDAVTAAFRIHGASTTTIRSRDNEDFAAQQRTVVERHIDAIPRERRAAVRRLAEASIAVNTALAAAASGHPGKIVSAIGSVVALGPIGAARYLHCSRIVERVVPRVRARLAGAL
jgi:glycosyltransferase involved in cell wall biosynthesis